MRERILARATQVHEFLDLMHEVFFCRPDIQFSVCRDESVAQHQFALQASNRRLGPLHTGRVFQFWSCLKQDRHHAENTGILGLQRHQDRDRGLKVNAPDLGRAFRRLQDDRNCCIVFIGEFDRAGRRLLEKPAGLAVHAIEPDGLRQQGLEQGGIVADCLILIESAVHRGHSEP